MHVSGVYEEFLDYVDDLLFIFRSWITLCFLIMIYNFILARLYKRRGWRRHARLQKTLRQGKPLYQI